MPYNGDELTEKSDLSLFARTKTHIASICVHKLFGQKWKQFGPGPLSAGPKNAFIAEKVVPRHCATFLPGSGNFFS